MESRRFRGEDLDGLVAIAPGLSGLPFWVWCWTGGVAEEAEPLVLVTRDPSLPDPPAGRVAVHPEVAAALAAGAAQDLGVVKSFECPVIKVPRS